MKICALINEDLGQMSLGFNTSLSGFLAAVDLGFEVFVLDISVISSDSNLNGLSCIFLDQNNSKKLVEAFKKQNQEFGDGYDFDQKIQDVKVCEIGFDFEKRKIDFDEIDFIYQRLEPMKFPFFPVGKENILKYLSRFSSEIFVKNKKYNLPIDCYGDKELALVIGENVGVKTLISDLDDSNLVKKALEIENKKIVLKPDNSAQSTGVFAVEFGEDGFLIGDFLQKNIFDLFETQLYKINKNQSENDILKILKILFFVQGAKALKKQGKLFENKKIVEFDFKEIEKTAKSLYNDKILVQPFLEGVKVGDVRINLLKFGENFEIVGGVVRKSLAENEDKFTTGLTGGGAKAMRIEDVLSIDEQKDLTEKLLLFLKKINGELKEKYQNSYELGLDFLLFGDDKKVFLGEANHHCQALIPFVEALEKKSGDESFCKKIGAKKIEYDFGLGVMKEFFRNQFKN